MSTPLDTEKLFAAIVEHGPAAIMVCDSAGAIRYANSSAAALLGCPQPIDGMTVSEIAQLLGRPRSRNPRALVRWARKRASFDVDFPTGRDTCLPLAVRVAATEIDGAPILIASVRDISSRRAEAAEREALQRRLATVLEIADDAIISVDSRQQIIMFNRGAERIFGYATGELIGRRLTMLMPSRFHDAHASNIRRFGHGTAPSRMMGQRQEITGRRKDGREFPAEASISHFRLGDETIFTAILRDVSARKRLERSLAAAKEHAEAGRDMIYTFMVNMSHELRTPLNAIIGFSDLMRAQMLGPLGADRYRDYAEDIHASSEHLLDLINELLDYAKVQSGRSERQEIEFTLSSVLRLCLRMIEPRANDSGIALRHDFAAGIGLNADERHVRQIVLNLLSNALKYTHRGGTIVLVSRLNERQEVVIEVSDTGIGISAKDLPRVLEPFGQVQNAENLASRGTGLGLPLTKRLVELHGGRLDIRSAEGKGTTVSACFPPERGRFRDERLA